MFRVIGSNKTREKIVAKAANKLLLTIHKQGYDLEGAKSCFIFMYDNPMHTDNLDIQIDNLSIRGKLSKKLIKYIKEEN